METKHRIQFIKTFLQKYKLQADIIAIQMSKEIGKPILQAKADIAFDIDYIQWHIENAENILQPEVVHQDKQSIHTMYFEAKGVA